MRLSALDGLRGLFALMIVLLHLPYAFIFYDGPVVRNAFIVVDFFFVLSGSVLSLGYGERLNNLGAGLRFMALRVGRLWPLHIFILILYLAFMAVKLGVAELGIFQADIGPLDRVFWANFVQDTFLLHVFRNELYYTLNFPAWSISAEMLAYTVFMVGCVIGALIGGRNAMFAVVAGFGILGLAGVIALPFGKVGIFSVLAAFFVGHFVHRLWQAHHQAGHQLPRPALCEGAYLIAFGLVLWFYRELPYASLLAIAVFAASVYTFAWQAGPISRLLNTGPFQLLGERSYSIYMIHVFVLSVISSATRIIERLLGLDLHVPAVIDGKDIDLLSLSVPGLTELAVIIVLLLVVWVSGLTYRFIEMPGQQFARRLFSKPRQTEQSAS